MNSNQPSKKMEEVDNKNHEVDDTYALPVNHHSQTVSKLSCKEKICHVIKNVTVEPTIILSTVAAAMQELLIQDLVTDQTCLVTYGNSEEFCANVTNVAFSAELNKQTTTYNYYRTTLETIPSIFIALFFGPWSDKYGTKLLVFIPIIGDILSGVFYTVLSYIRYVRPQYLLLGSVIQGLHGGNLTFNLGVCCFIIRESSILSRTTRIAFTDVAFFIGIPFGRQLGVLIRSQYGAEAVFGVAIQFNIIALCYAFWRLRGTQNMNIQDISKVKAFQEMFKLENLKNCLAVMFKKRAGKKRIHVILIMLCAQLIVFPRKGKSQFLYEKKSRAFVHMANNNTSNTSLRVHTANLSMKLFNEPQ